MEIATDYDIEQFALFLSGQEYDNIGFSFLPESNLDALQIDLCRNLYETGCRYADLVPIVNVVETAPTTTRIQVAKGGNIITVANELLTTHYLDAVDHNIETYPTCRYGSFIYYLRRATAPLMLYVGKKPILAHIFRYAFVRRKTLEGHSIAEISTMIGEKDDKNTRGYRDGLIEIKGRT